VLEFTIFFLNSFWTLPTHHRIPKEKKRWKRMRRCFRLAKVLYAQ
jgi:hypothetical protein